MTDVAESVVTSLAVGASLLALILAVFAVGLVAVALRAHQANRELWVAHYRDMHDMNLDAEGRR